MKPQLAGAGHFALKFGGGLGMRLDADRLAPISAPSVPAALYGLPVAKV